MMVTVLLKVQTVTVTMTDSYGDGGGSITINGATYTCTGSSDAFVFCMDLSVCTDITYAATDSWSYENSWSLSDASGAVVASGGAESGHVGDCTFGCMDNLACNYNADANVEDGGCLYSDAVGACGGNCLEDILPEGGNGICDDVDVIGCVVPGSCNYAEDVTILEPCVYPDQCGVCGGDDACLDACGVPNGDDSSCYRLYRCCSL